MAFVTTIVAQAVCHMTTRNKRRQDEGGNDVTKRVKRKPYSTKGLHASSKSSTTAPRPPCALVTPTRARSEHAFPHHPPPPLPYVFSRNIFRLAFEKTKAINGSCLPIILRWLLLFLFGYDLHVFLVSCRLGCGGLSLRDDFLCFDRARSARFVHDRLLFLHDRLPFYSRRRCRR